MIITPEILRKIAPRANQEVLDGLAEHLPGALKRYGIDTPLRVSHFLGQAAHESDGFRTLQEYASGSAYEGRQDLGNVRRGDGRRFKGRGIFQLTGRANYAKVGQRLGVDLVNNPELAATAEISVLTACEYWNSRQLSKAADADNIKIITKKINGGYNGLTERIRYTNKARQIVDEIFADEDDEDEQQDDWGNDPVVLKRGDQGPKVEELQQKLHDLVDTDVEVDGDFGPATERAVAQFQKENGFPVTGKLTQSQLEALMVE